MEKHYDMSKATPEEIVEDFLAEEAMESIKEMEDQGYECVGVYDIDWFVNGGKNEVFDQLAADMK